MVTTSVQQTESSESEKRSFWSSVDLLVIAGIMLTIAVIWRILDQFVLDLGNAWMNIMPSKIFPLIIMLVFFWRFRRSQIDSVLGLSRKQFRAQIFMGIILVLLISVFIDLGGTIIYATFIDPTYPLGLHIINPDLLGYLFCFFLVNAFLEESLFRGLIQNSLKTRVSQNQAIFSSAVMFGIWHAGWPLVNGITGIDMIIQVSSMIFFTTILGLLFGVYYEYFSSGQSLVGPIIAHTFFNFISECFKLGPEPVIQGPDLVFSTAGLMMVSFLLFFGVFIFLFILFWRFRIEQVEALGIQFKERLLHKIRVFQSSVPNENTKQDEV